MMLSLSNNVQQICWITSRNKALICFMSLSAKSRKTWESIKKHVQYLIQKFHQCAVYINTLKQKCAQHKQIAEKNGNKWTHLLSALYRKLRKNILFKPANHHCCLHQIVQFFMVTCTLINSKNSLEDPRIMTNLNTHSLTAKGNLAN